MIINLTINIDQQGESNKIDITEIQLAKPSQNCYLEFIPSRGIGDDFFISVHFVFGVSY